MLYGYYMETRLDVKEIFRARKVFGIQQDNLFKA